MRDVVIDSKNLKNIYRRIDWSKPAPAIPGWNEPLAEFTNQEVQIKNNALRMNRTTYRWVLNDRKSM